ncbi:MAG: transcription-repair coupling factor, partial [Chloroflexi bacterium]|nr:transcription-repair coupling factor [Chloroflexota bacterium]
PVSPQPVRVEFVGDEIASIRVFDPATQRSAQEIQSARIAPASEVLPQNARAVAQNIARWNLDACHPVAASTYKRDQDALAQGQRFNGIEFYLPYFYTPAVSLVEHFSNDALIVVENWSEVEAHALALAMQAQEVRGDLIARRELPPNVREPYFEWDELRAQIVAHKRLLFDFASPDDSMALPFAVGPRYGGQLKKVVDEIAHARARNESIIVVTRQADRLADLLREKEIFAKPIDAISESPRASEVMLVQGALADGWVLKESGKQKAESGEPFITPPSAFCHLLTDAELFGWSRPKPRKISKPRATSPEAFFSDVSDGDYVVHIDHGIGIFRGLQTLELNGPEREYLKIEYAQGDTLFVPAHQIDRLSRYVAPEKRAPILHRLGTAEWESVKERTRRAVQEIAGELLELYAARAIVTGHAFNQDSEWQRELEAAFPYVETQDQLKAIDQVKADMERAQPMDRLVVGDVGYGKTEVALRAAFKAAENGKQVAMLVPTTVLAQQHFSTFKERLAPFPMNVEMLSRFRSDKEQKEIVEKIREGRVDILIGTHRLLSGDVQFKDLGLLIIDEEQRFGVVHKEKLKQLRTQVDVLTLTATPIPRTLYMSLSGARDMSTIDTPPEDRLPIKTYVAEYDERLVRDAILRELDRGGQVFFVHNRVIGIGVIAEQLRKLVPEANLAIGHGQMPEEELEAVMYDFSEGKYDVLICTTIIESGIDIPNANTLIVNHADKFGMAQLYQLRGRVGRSAARAYAYLLYEKHNPLSADAHDRLQAIAEASELGAGFQIAMRDMELRGAGEILGARQSGHIAAVGFDLYCRLLSQAIEQQRAQRSREDAEPARLWQSPLIDLPIQAQIPEEYVADSALRLKLYRRLADVDNIEQVEELEKELRERFGAPPPALQNMFYLLRLKVAATRARLEAIAVEDGRIVIKFGRDDPALQSQLTVQFNGRVRAARDRAWLAGPQVDEQWREHLLVGTEYAGSDHCGNDRTHRGKNRVVSSNREEFEHTRSIGLGGTHRRLSLRKSRRWQSKYSLTRLMRLRSLRQVTPIIQRRCRSPISSNRMELDSSQRARSGWK